MFRRALSGSLAALVLAAGLASGAVAGPAHPRRPTSTAIPPIEGATRDDPHRSPRALYLPGSNGFGVVVAAVPGKEAGHGLVYVEAAGPDGTVGYSVRGDLAHEGIKANLGSFGRIDLRWVPSGGVRRTPGTCAGYPWSRYWDAGAYVGSLWFRGGNGFTEAKAQRIVWRRKWYGPHSVCGLGVSEGFPGPGTILTAEPTGGGPSSPHLSVVRNGPKEKVICGAWMSEGLGRITVSREAFVEGKSSTLTVPSSYRTGELSPPAPFSGTGLFERTEHAKGTWLGDLSVEFPDGFVQPLAGPSFEATLHSGFHEVSET